MNKEKKTIKIFNTSYKLRFVDKIEPKEEGDFTFGICDSASCTIEVATKGTDNKPLKDDVIELSLLHELVHAILNEGQYKNSSNDEPLVEWLAKCLKHLIDQQVI